MEAGRIRFGLGFAITLPLLHSGGETYPAPKYSVKNEICYSFFLNHQSGIMLAGGPPSKLLVQI
jgi:hypothetical protein